MSDRAGSTAASRGPNRANWVGLRTLRQVPRVVDRTSGGEPIYEIRSVRLILPRDARHFARLVSCSKCGREVPGPTVLTPSDLDNPAHRVICKDCVRAATVPMFNSERSRSAVVVPDPPASPETVHDEDRLAAVERLQIDAGRVEALERRLDEVIARLEPAASSDGGELRAVLAATRDDDRLTSLEQQARTQAAELAAHRTAFERRLDEVVTRLETAASSQSRELHAALEAAVAGMRTAIQGDADRTDAAVGDLARRSDQRDQVLDASHQELERMRAVVEDVTLRSSSVSATVASTRDEVARIELQVNDRLDRQAERAARTATSGGERVEAVEALLRQELDRLTSAVDEHSVELRNALAEALEEMRSAIPSIEDGTARRLAAMEQLVEQRAAELADLAHVQATLDRGLGELRLRIAEVAEATSRLAARQQELDGRVAERADPHAASPPARRGLGRRSPDAAAQMAAVSAATDHLVRDRQAFNARLDEVEVAADQATAASARASARASELAPLRADVRALREELLEHHEALESLRKSVDRLRRKAAAPPAEAKPAKRASKR